MAVTLQIEDKPQAKVLAGMIGGRKVFTADETIFEWGDTEAVYAQNILTEFGFTFTVKTITIT